jgi:hypothetical protein
MAIILLFGFGMVCWMGFSLLLLELFNKVTDLDNSNNLKEAYFLAAICGLLWLLVQIGRQNAYYLIPIFVGKIRNILIFLIYAKLSKISQYTAKSQ